MTVLFQPHIYNCPLDRCSRSFSTREGAREHVGWSLCPPKGIPPKSIPPKSIPPKSIPPNDRVATEFRGSYTNPLNQAIEESKQDSTSKTPNLLHRALKSLEVLERAASFVSCYPLSRKRNQQTERDRALPEYYEYNAAELRDYYGTTADLGIREIEHQQHTKVKPSSSIAEVKGSATLPQYSYERMWDSHDSLNERNEVLSKIKRLPSPPAPRARGSKLGEKLTYIKISNSIDPYQSTTSSPSSDKTRSQSLLPAQPPGSLQQKRTDLPSEVTPSNSLRSNTCTPTWPLPMNQIAPLGLDLRDSIKRGRQTSDSSLSHSPTLSLTVRPSARLSAVEESPMFPQGTYFPNQKSEMDAGASYMKSHTQSSQSQLPYFDGNEPQSEQPYGGPPGTPSPSFGIIGLYDSHHNLLSSTSYTFTPSSAAMIGEPNLPESFSKYGIDQPALSESIAPYLPKLSDAFDGSDVSFSHGLAHPIWLKTTQASFVKPDTTDSFRGLSEIDTNIITDANHQVMSPEIESAISTSSSKTLVDSPSQMDLETRLWKSKYRDPQIDFGDLENRLWNSEYRDPRIDFGSVGQSMQRGKDGSCLDRLANDPGQATSVDGLGNTSIETKINVTELSNSPGRGKW